MAVVHLPSFEIGEKKEKKKHDVFKLKAVDQWANCKHLHNAHVNSKLTQLNVFDKGNRASLLLA